MIEKLLKAAVFAIILSCITMASTLPEIIMNIVIAGVVGFAGNTFYQLIQKINLVFEYITAHKEKHIAMDEKIDRIEMESKEQYHELKVQVERLNDKIDDLMDEIKIKS